MKKVFTIFTVAGVVALLPGYHVEAADPSNDMSSLITYNLEAKSLSNVEQTTAIYKEIMKEKDSGKTEVESYQALNEKLKVLTLPQFNPFSQNFKIMATLASSHLPKKDPVVGFEIEDESHLFCFPCKIGYGNYRFGILKK